MKNEIENNNQREETEQFTYECLTKFREPLLSSMVHSLNIPDGSKGLDAGCAIGRITRLLAETVGQNGHVTGLDLSKDFIHYAEKNYRAENLRFAAGNIKTLPFDDYSFDWLWSMDTVWPGPEEFGCPAKDPLIILKEYDRVLKPGGSVFISFWSSQKLLPGYPLLEARLNTTSSAAAPFTKGMNPVNHFMNARYWFQEAGLSHIGVKTYSGDIVAPLHENDRQALYLLFQMLWGESEAEVSVRDWQDFKRLCDPASEDYILNNPHYYGFYTYTLFKGTKPG